MELEQLQDLVLEATRIGATVKIEVVPPPLLLSQRQAAELLNVSTKFLQDHSDDLIEGVHFSFLGSKLVYDRVAILHWARFANSDPKIHRQFCKRILKDC